MTTKNILITGATGFIGSALLQRLLNQSVGNCRFILLSRKQQNLEGKYSQNIIWVEGNINDLDLMCSIILNYKINTIYHLAAQALITEYFNNPYLSYIDTVMGQVTILEAVRNVGMKHIEKIIIITSYKVYGNSKGPFTEETLFDPQNTYETAKSCQDLIAKNYFFSYGLPINIIRACNIFGPNDKNNERLIPKTIYLIKNNNCPEVFKTVRNNKREYLYIDDAIDAILLIEKKANPGEVYCLSGDIYLTIENIVNKICSVMEFPQGYNLIDDNIYSKESNEHKIDNSKLKKLGWMPKVMFKSGLIKCIESIQ